MVPDETPPPQPERARTETIVTAGGKVIEMAGPPVRYTVKKGEGLDAIARKLDTDRTTLAKDNKLKPPYLLKPGKVLKGPTTTLKAYVVENGDTVFNVAQRFNVKADALSRANNLRRGAAIKKGQKLVLPSGYKDRGPIRRVVTVSGGPRFTPTGPAAPAYQAPASTPSYSNPSAGPSAYSPPVTTPSAPIPYRPSRPSGSGGAILDAAPPPSDAQIAALGAGRFAWPLKGDIRSLYGPKGGGQRNDGIDIAAPAGSPVRAAADGEVVYAGDQVPGFGNLVLIKHADGWVTAYAHLSRALVSMRQRISQGDQLGLVGTSGGVSEPQLHFEVRYSPSPKEKARAVDPGLVLPK
jgi:murein DD-endopeptidase MepM/ murein hydrolase activator NlpD